MRAVSTRTIARTLAAIGLVLALIAGGLWAYTARLGWWGGPLTRWVPATAAAPPRERGMVAVYWSGDSGFNTGMLPRVTARLAAHGLPVLTVNSLTAFRDRRSPAEVAALVRDTAEQALRQKGAARLVLIGHSFGANVLLAGVEQLPPALRARVATVVLLVPGDTMLFRATPGGALDFGADDGPAIGFARRLDWVPVLCVHGEVEEHSLCPLWHAPNLLVRTLPGGHYLGHDDAAVARAVLTQVARTA